jgi:hypothetical protein
MRGVPMGVIAEQLGHAGTRMTEKHYAHLAPSYVHHRAHFPKLGITGERETDAPQGLHRIPLRKRMCVIGRTSVDYLESASKLTMLAARQAVQQRK